MDNKQLCLNVDSQHRIRIQVEVKYANAESYLSNLHGTVALYVDRTRCALCSGLLAFLVLAFCLLLNRVRLRTTTNGD